MDDDARVLVDNLGVLMRGLRRAHFPLGTADLKDALKALQCVNLADPVEVEAALAALWCRDWPSRQVFRAAFEQWVMLLLRQSPDVVGLRTYLAEVASRRRDASKMGGVSWFPQPADGELANETVSFGVGATRDEVWRYRPLDRLSDDELHQLLTWYRPRRPLQGWARLYDAKPTGRRLNLGETMRRGREGSEWVRMYFDRPRLEPLRVTLLLDLSGSTQHYHRPLLQFLHAMMRHERALEVYGFSTRLTRLTPALRLTSVDRALAEVAALAPHRGGGTRIGDSLKDLWERERGRGIGGRSTLVVISDGFDEESEDLDRWLSRWAGYLHGRVHWWHPGPSDPRQSRIASVRTLAKHTRVWRIFTLNALGKAWEALQQGESASPEPFGIMEERNEHLMKEGQDSGT
ncbi:MAG: VWA domain-containing protein [Firmicutes bacterium]|nr:VWA domain-containing protein [Bacillota bacterium]